MGILQSTDNILALYQHSIGTTRVPMALYQWSCLSGIAACVEDRVFVEKLAKPLSPQIWVMLIAKSGVGKGTAINELMPYMVSAGVNLYYGEVTAERLAMRMSGKIKEGHQARSKIFLVNEEAAVCIRYGPRAKDFIIFMTGSYQLPKGVPYRKEAVTSGQYAIHDSTINWLLGSTMEWAVDSIPTEAIEGGFLGRILPVHIPHYELSKVVARRPDDYDEVRAHLVERFCELREVKGQFKVSKQARATHHRWDQQREPPRDERLIPTYIRMDDNVWKLAMVFSLAESLALRIHERHMQQAIMSVQRLTPAAIDLLNASAVTDRTKDLGIIEHILRTHTTMKRSVLMTRCSSRGINKAGMDGALDMIRTKGRLKTITNRPIHGRAGLVYSYITRHSLV